MYAIVEIAGFDYKVKPGDHINVPHQSSDAGAELEFTKVKLLHDDVKLHYSPDASVKARVLKHHRGDKVIVYKFKKRKGYRLKRGYSDTLTSIEVLEIKTGGKK